MDEIYLIICEDGEYSDYMCWIAQGLFSEKEAKKTAETLSLESKRLKEIKRAGLKEYWRIGREYEEKTGESASFSEDPIIQSVWKAIENVPEEYDFHTVKVEKLELGKPVRIERRANRG